MMIELNPSQADLLHQYLLEILEANKITNLTRIESLDEAELLHIEDSLVGVPEIEAAPQGRYADLGTGGGFPGVPVAVATGRQALLVDSVKKKMKLVADALDSLELGNQIQTYDGRIEELALDQPGAFAVVSARALTRLNSLLELASPLLMKGGRLVCYKAQLPEGELDEALAMVSRVGMSFVSERSVVLSDGETERTILVFEKTAEPDIVLPRRIGQAQKSPLKPRH